MSLVERFERGVFGPVSSARVRALELLVYGLLAFDLLTEMLSHGSRYGVGGLNVAHFAWLDLVQPLPVAGTYVGVILASATLAASLALGVGGRVARWSLFGLYTYGWAMSQMDSYQHHVFLSIVLFCVALDPPGDTLLRVRCAWGHQLLMASVAIVYGFTGLSKTEEPWLQGDVLIHINSSQGKFEPLRRAAESLGMSDASFWWLNGHAVVLVQWVIMVGYLAIFFDPSRARTSTRWLSRIALMFALVFHAGAEYLELRIGWFSFYMIALALVTLGPRSPWSALVRGLGIVGDRLAVLFQGAGRRALLGCLVMTALGGLSSSYLVDLPASWVLGATPFIMALLACRLEACDASRFRVAFVALVVTVSATTVLLESRTQYDFYRFLGGDLNRRGAPVAALDAYGLANTWAPNGEGRQAKVRRIQSNLRSFVGGGSW